MGFKDPRTAVSKKIGGGRSFSVLQMRLQYLVSMFRLLIVGNSQVDLNLNQ